MNKGFIYATEGIVIFMGWMMILLLVWQTSSHALNQQTNEWAEEKTLEQAIMQSDTLILQHHENPWFGCAAYSQEKKRTMEYEVNEKCLYSLSSHAPTPFIYGISMVKKSNKTILFEKNIPPKSICTNIKRLLVLEETKETALLEVMACDD